MKTSMKLLAGLSSVLMVSASANAETLTGTASAPSSAASFSNHLHSPLMVSPAQLYQVDGNVADFSVDFGTSTDSVGSTDTDGTAYGVTGTGLYTIVPGFKFGLEVGYGDSSAETKIDGAKREGTDTMFAVAPIALYDLGPVAVAYKPTFYQSESEVKVDGVTTDSDTSYAQHTVAALFKMDALETGLAYTSEKDDLGAVQEASIMALHGRYMLTNEFGLGAIVTNTAFSALETAPGADAKEKDSLSTMLTAEWTMPGAVRLEGGLGYTPAYYDGKENISASNIETWEIMAGADYMISNAAAVGGLLSWETGSESNNNVDFERDALAFGIRGNVAF